MQDECRGLKSRLTEPAVQKTVNACDVSTMTGEPVEELSPQMTPLEDPSSSSSDEEPPPRVEVHQRGLQPEGFKELRFRVNKFSGKDKTDDFEVWVEDYKEATADCGWKNDQRARWFSWFLSGPVKATWQRSLKDADKASWERIVEVYRGQYGIH